MADAPFPKEMMPCIERFFREVHPTLKPGQNFYQEVFDTDLFFPLQRQRELASMIRLARTIEPKTVMEIGADKGGGLYHWCMCLPSVKNVIACEIRGTPYEHEFEKAFPNLNFFWCRDSQDSIDEDGEPMFQWLPGKIDILFIDGDKTKMYEDYKLHRPVMNKGGLIFIHDIRDIGPNLAWRKIQKEQPERPESADWDTCEILDVTDYEYIKDREPWTSHEQWLKHWRGRSCGVGVVRT